MSWNADVADVAVSGTTYAKRDGRLILQAQLAELPKVLANLGQILVRLRLSKTKIYAHLNRRYRTTTNTVAFVYLTKTQLLGQTARHIPTVEGL